MVVEHCGTHLLVSYVRLMIEIENKKIEQGYCPASSKNLWAKTISKPSSMIVVYYLINKMLVETTMKQSNINPVFFITHR